SGTRRCGSGTCARRFSSTYEGTRVPRHVWNLPCAGPGVVDDTAMTESAPPPPSPPPPALPYGTWPSPITAADVAGRRGLAPYPRAIGRDVGGQQRRPAEGGRGQGVPPG